MSSISFPNEPLISWTFLRHFFHQKKKCSTDQNCIRKRNTTHKIGTLIEIPYCATYIIWLWSSQKRFDLPSKIHTWNRSSPSSFDQRVINKWRRQFFAQYHKKKFLMYAASPILKWSKSSEKKSCRRILL